MSSFLCVNSQKLSISSKQEQRLKCLADAWHIAPADLVGVGIELMYDAYKHTRNIAAEHPATALKKCLKSTGGNCDANMPQAKSAGGKRQAGLLRTRSVARKAASSKIERRTPNGTR